MGTKCSSTSRIVDFLDHKIIMLFGLIISKWWWRYTFYPDSRRRIVLWQKGDIIQSANSIQSARSTLCRYCYPTSFAWFSQSYAATGISLQKINFVVLKRHINYVADCCRCCVDGRGRDLILAAVHAVMLQTCPFWDFYLWQCTNFTADLRRSWYCYVMSFEVGWSH